MHPDSFIKAEDLSMTTIDVTQTGRSNNISCLLRELRLRVDPHARMLGAHERPNTRRGRRVSQEELAEAIGVSRCWYGLLESGAPAQPSVSLLNRLASALNASDNERVTLFSLAIPGLRGVLSDV
jgi:DNA-binding XRE family transcriptional regulator